MCKRLDGSPSGVFGTNRGVICMCDGFVFGYFGLVCEDYGYFFVTSLCLIDVDFYVLLSRVHQYLNKFHSLTKHEKIGAKKN